MKISAEWMKLDVNIFSHPKIRRIRRMPEGDSVFTLWIYFLCEGMKNSDNPGVIELTAGIPAEDLDIADDTRIKIDTVKMAIVTFHELGMIVTDEFSDAIAIKNIRKHQSIDQLEYKRELNRQRVNKFRQKKNSLEIENTSKDVMHYSNAGNEQSRVDKTRVEKTRKDKIKKESKHKYGEHSNVLLTDTEYKKLSEKLTEPTLKEMIEKLSLGIAMKGYKYKSHNLAIQKWFSNQKPVNQTNIKYPSKADKIENDYFEGLEENGLLETAQGMNNEQR